MARLKDEDRAFLDDNFRRYGGAWAGGLAALERDFELDANVGRKKYVLVLTLRKPPHLRFELEVQKKTGAMSNRSPELPKGRELDGVDRARFDAILQAEVQLWLIERMNNYVVRIPVPRGLADLGSAKPRGDGSRTRETFDGLVLTATRRSGDLAIACFEAPPMDHACVVVDLVRGTIADPVWVELPMSSQARWLRSEERAWIDEVMRLHGDFGVYGNVRRGLGALLDDGMDIQLRVSDAEYQLGVEPRDGHGHFLHFTIDRSARTIGNVVAGHSEPAPPPTT